MDVDAERIFLQPIGVGRRLDGDGEDGVPALGRGQRVVDIAPLDPVDPEAVVGGADNTGDFDRDLRLADLGEGIAGPG